MNSLVFKKLYDSFYFLNIVEGFDEFKSGKIPKKKKDLVDLLNFKDKKVLDVGCGRGEVLRYCIENGAKECFGIDFSKAAIKIAKKFCSKLKVKFYNISLSDVEILDVSEISIVYLLDIMEHVSDREFNMFFEKIKEKISDDCIFLITSPKDHFGDYKGMHFNYWDFNKVNKYFRKKFNEVIIQFHGKEGKKSYHIFVKGIK